MQINKIHKSFRHVRAKPLANESLVYLRLKQTHGHNKFESRQESASTLFLRRKSDPIDPCYADPSTLQLH
jgi:hypothetical protein